MLDSGLKQIDRKFKTLLKEGKSAFMYLSWYMFWQNGIKIVGFTEQLYQISRLK